MTLSAYFTAEAGAVLEAVGLPASIALIVLRAAPLGETNSAVAAAAFRGFPLEVIDGVLASSRGVLTPAAAITGMHDAVVAVARRQLPHLVDDERVADIADRLIDVIRTLDVTGRPLAAGGQAITAPDSATAPVHPWARLWRAANTLREYRGDAHIAALTAAALPRVQADVLTAAWGAAHMDVPNLRTSRSLDDATWSAASAALEARGLLTHSGEITDSGQSLRDHIEQQTDSASAWPWAQLGAAHTADAWELFNESSASLIENGHMVGTTPVGSPWPAHTVKA